MTTTPESEATFRGVGPEVEPSPSWPEVLSPQHQTPPSATAQVCVQPAAIAVTLPVISDGWTGEKDDARPARPSCPLSFAPQQRTSSATTAQVWLVPAESAVTSQQPPAHFSLPS
jgi:hypothetical protein